jgi:Fe-S cluster biogenesis protein NfuA
MSEREKQEFLSRIDQALDDIRPHLRIDGGDVEVVDLTESMHVRIKWLGNCQTCTMSEMTLKAGVTESLKRQIPEIQGVEAVNAPEA